MPIQHIVDKPSRAALFLVLGVSPGGEDEVRDLISSFAGLVKSVDFRYSAENLFAVLGIGARLWSRLTSAPAPSALREFQPIEGALHRAPATDGDLLFHFRADSYDVCYELASQLLQRLGSAVTVLDETQGFKYLDQRDLLGFVDGTANPTGPAALDCVLLDDAADYPGSSYITVQKYLHDMAAWRALSVEEQERVIGRSKVDDIEMDDDVKPSNSHVALNDLDEDIYRENMVFGSFKEGHSGTYFIGYARDPEQINERLSNMFVGDPVGNYDRILDYSTAVTGTNFFAPSVELMDSFGELPLP